MDILNRIKLNKFVYFLFCSMILAILTGIHFLSNWWVFRISGTREIKIRETSNFSDLEIIMSFLPCYRLIENDVYQTDDNFECHKGYMYGIMLLRVFNFLKLDLIPIGLVATFLLTIFLLGLGAVASSFTQKNKLHLWFVILIIFSPGTWLAIERANLDILIIFMLLVASQCLSRGFEISGILIVCFSSLLKFYTLPLVLVLIVISHRMKTKVLGSIAFLVILPMVVVDISAITNPGFPSTWYISFGVRSSGLYLNLLLEQLGLEKYLLNSIEVQLLSYVIFSVACILIVKLNKSNLLTFRKVLFDRSKFQTLRYPDNLVCIFGVTFISCYLAGMSFDYRLIFLGVAGVEFIRKSNLLNLKMKGKYFFLAVSLWFSGSFLPSTSLILSGIFQVIGDIAILFISAFFIAACTLEIKSKIRSQKKIKQNL
jgi:hypothetical protein